MPDGWRRYVKYSNRDLLKHIKGQDGQIESLNKQLAEANADKAKYWNMYEEQLRKTKELSVEGNKAACEFYLDCELANAMCTTANDLNAGCKQRTSIKEEINRRVKEVTNV